MGRPGIIVIFITLLCQLSLTAQDGELPALLPSYITEYGAEQGIPNKCVDAIVYDSSGCMILLSCPAMTTMQGVVGFRFDGSEAYPIRLQPQNSGTMVVAASTRLAADGTIYGTCHKTRYPGDKDSLWLFTHNAFKGQTDYSFIGINDTIVQSVALQNELKLHVLIKTQQTFRILCKEKSGLRQICAFENVGDVPGSIPTLFDKIGNAFWIVDQPTIYSVVPGAPAEVFNVPNDKPANSILAIEPDKAAFIYNHAGSSEIQYYWDEQHGISEQVDYDIPNLPHKRAGAFRDEAGNLLVWNEQLSGEYRARLYSVDGIDYDYSTVLNTAVEMAGGPLLYSRDFRFEAINFEGSIHVVEIASEAFVTNISTRPTRSIAELANGDLAVSVDFEIKTFSRNSDRTGDTEFSENRDATEFTIGPQGHVWGINYSGQLEHFDPATGVDRFETLVLNKTDARAIGFITQDQLLVIGQDGVIQHLTSPDNFVNQVEVTAIGGNVTGFINQLFVSASGNAWVGSSEGLWKVVLSDSGSIRTKQTLANLRVNRILEDNDGHLWLGTHFSGIHIYHPATGEVEVIDEDRGLSNNTVATMLQDNDGDIWVGTFNGVTAISQDRAILGHLYEIDGLGHNECNRWSALKLRDGTMCFGGLAGLSLINPEGMKTRWSQQPSVTTFISEVSYFDPTLDQDVTSYFESDWSQSIVLPASHRYLQLMVGNSQYTEGERNTFSYLLEGKRETWTYVGRTRNIRINDLPAGTYDVLVRSKDYQGREASNVLRIHVRVKDHFYRQWWFYALCAMPFLGFAVVWIRRQRLEQKRLESEVSRRTAQIQEQSEVLRDQAQQLKEADELKSQIYTNITHEFRTPLTVISGMAAEAGSDPNAPQLIRRNADQLLNLINQMLDLRKLETGHSQPDYVLGDVVKYLRYLGESFQSYAKRKSLTFHFLSDQASIEMDYDPNKLQRIVTNLLSNAIKFTPEGGNIYLEVDEQQIEGAEKLVIKVRDTGIGIPEEERKVIFSRFYQVDSSATRRGEGTGIGLTLVVELVKLFQGTIDVHSQPGRGSTFTVILPVTRTADTKAAPQILPPQLPDDWEPVADLASTVVQDTDSERPLVLITEDNTDVIHYLIACLRDQFELAIAMNGQEGIDKAIELVPDVIISDVMMPIKDGFELLETIKADEKTSHIPIVLLTAKADMESRIAGLQRGADAYLAKPFEKDELLVRIQQLIELRRRLQQRYAAVEGQQEVTDTDIQIEDAFVTRLREAILDRLDDDQLDVAALCEILQMSRRQLQRKVKALTDKSPVEYLRFMRMHKARVLLRQPNLNISEVGYSVGYQDPAYFSKVFQGQHGVSPKEWREAIGS